MTSTPEALPQDFIESWRQTQEDLDNRIQTAEATLGKLIHDLHSARRKVKLCENKLKDHPHDDGSQAELKSQLEDFEEKEGDKVAEIQAHLQQISRFMEETLRERCAEEVRATGMKMENLEDGAGRLLEEWRLATIRLWELRDETAA
ncbi:hypothetical protein KC323_g6421 [Hortaea werneckii]|nr:hypothetical protein KC323_g6421 [Hortaea werneckii]